ncbi:hypothetical protein GCM10022262_07620 [Georgenia daeguensis]|uniref:Uncharacterized protein n=1 Tax=Georgenia daeguensis TaxID=908355 RepID=A0ABP8ER40_9MICO
MSWGVPSTAEADRSNQTTDAGTSIRYAPMPAIAIPVRARPSSVWAAWLGAAALGAPLTVRS